MIRKKSHQEDNMTEADWSNFHRDMEEFEIEDAAQAQRSILGKELSRVPVLRPDQKENAG